MTGIEDITKMKAHREHGCANGSQSCRVCRSSARADEHGDRSSRGYTNADIKGGYGCGVSGSLNGAGIVATRNFSRMVKGALAKAFLH